MSDQLILKSVGTRVTASLSI